MNLFGGSISVLIVSIVVLTTKRASAFLTPTGVSSVVSHKSPATFLQAQVPIVEEWEVLRNGALRGMVKNHPTIPNGDVITTSPLADPSASRNNGVVVTKSGSQYRLGTGKGGASKAPASFNNRAKTPAPTPVVKAPAPSPAPARQTVVKAASQPKEKSLQEQLREAKKEYGLNGKTADDGNYLLVGSPLRSTSFRSKIYYGYRSDANGLPTGPRLTVKTSTAADALARENENYNRITRGIFFGQFVKKLQYLPVASSSGEFKGSSALVLESGDLNLRALMDTRKNRGLSGKALRQAAVAIAQCIQAVHSSGLVWTDLKAENFVVLADNLEAENLNNLSIKGIDLESAVPARGPPIDYSAEACPPEFALELKAGRGLDFQVQYNYDIWSYGILLYELAVGKSIWGGKSDGAITNQLVTPGFDIDVSDVPDNQLRSLIQDCLSLDPNRRPGITQLLLHPYFLTTGIGPISF